MKIDIVKVAGIAGTVLSVTATIIGSWAGKKETSDKIAQEVAKQLAEKKN